MDAVLPIDIKASTHSHFLHLARNLFQSGNWVDEITGYGNFFVFITHPRLNRLFSLKLRSDLDKAKLSYLFLNFPRGEKNKSFESYRQLIHQLSKRKIDKKTCLISLGGGTVSDMTGFLASSYLRGLPFISIPTTLLAMVDAAIGGKVAINCANAKNQIGHFYFPKKILVDPAFLSHLPDQEYLSGLAEIIKIALVSSRALFHTLLQNPTLFKKRDALFLDRLIKESIVLKKACVEKDPFEKGMRKILNFGHTAGHALESALNYRLSHGLAVAFGILIEAHLSHKMNLLTLEDLEAIEKLISQFRFSFHPLKKLSEKKFLSALAYDKKRENGQLSCVLLKSIGEPLVEAVSTSFIQKSLRELLK